MDSIEPELPDPPACLMLGLVGDLRTRFTFPHPVTGAMRPPSKAVDVARQSTYA
jgi:hypothetical protein